MNILKTLIKNFKKTELYFDWTVQFRLAVLAVIVFAVLKFCSDARELWVPIMIGIIVIGLPVTIFCLYHDVYNDQEKKWWSK
jgi:hypothetical protein